MNRNRSRKSTTTRTTRQSSTTKVATQRSTTSLASISSFSTTSYQSAPVKSSSTRRSAALSTAGRNKASASISSRKTVHASLSSGNQMSIMESPSRMMSTTSMKKAQAMPAAVMPSFTTSAPAWTKSDVMSQTFQSRRFFSSDKEKQKAAEDAQENAAADEAPADAPSSSDNEDDVKGLQAKYAALKKELEEFKRLNNAQELAIQEWQGKAKELQQRVLAEIDEQNNIHERYKREINDVKKFGVSKFCKNLLEGVDTLEMALKAANVKLETVDNPELANFREGVSMTMDMFAKILGEQGVVKYESLGKPADPNLHFIAAKLPQPDAEPGTITHVIKEGYMIQDRVLRPAQVCIAAEQEQ